MLSIQVNNDIPVSHTEVKGETECQMMDAEAKYMHRWKHNFKNNDSGPIYGTG